jgi:YtkA-like
VRRKLVILALGVGFLLLITWLGTLLTNTFLNPPTLQVQTAVAGPYQITLHVNPNPPSLTQPTQFSIQLVLKTSQKPVTGAQVMLTSSMDSMGMGPDNTTAHLQGNGTYLASVQFSESGTWLIQVTVLAPGEVPASAGFEVSTAGS